MLSQGNKGDQQEVYMIVVKPIKDEDFEEETWQGTIHELTHITKKQITALKKGLDQKTDKLQNFIQKQLEENRQNVNERI